MIDYQIKFAKELCNVLNKLKGLCSNTFCTFLTQRDGHHHLINDESSVNEDQTGIEMTSISSSSITILDYSREENEDRGEINARLEDNKSNCIIS